MKHSERFLAIVNDAKSRVREITPSELKARLDRGDQVALIDVREASEFDAGHLPGAQHLCKGIIERDIEKAVPDTGTEIVLYCGGGFRSALAADNLQKMGYTRVLSLAEGWRGWTEANYSIEK
jgi:rhodanese-related sulfurtransferase